MRRLIIVGAGGAGLEALMVAQRMGGWKVEGFADDAPRLAGATLEGTPVLGTLEEVVSRYRGAEIRFHCALGRNRIRKTKTELFESNGFAPATLIDPSAVVAATATVGEGTYVGPMVFVGPQAVVNRHVLVNVGVSVGHHSVSGNFVQLCPGVRVSGMARLGEGAFVGSNGILAPGVALGAWSVLGAASFAARDVPDGVTAVGVPARIVSPAAT